jgi:uncharacterized protein with PIN domain
LFGNHELQAIIAECGGRPGGTSNVIKTEWSVAFLAARRTNTAMKIMIDLHENLFSAEVENRSRDRQSCAKQAEMRFGRVRKAMKASRGCREADVSL